MINDLIQGNRHFVETEFNTHLSYYQGLAVAQTPKVLWIGCSDSRVSEHVITNSKPGQIFVHRNVANIVSFGDVNIAAIIEYAVDHLHVPDIVVCGHYGCGGIGAVDKGGIDSNYIGDWLLIASGAKDKADRYAKEHGLTDQQRLDLLVEENVRLQLKHLQAISLVKNAIKRNGLPRLHGWVYSVQSGQIKVLVDGRGE